ncbi:facilitated trehalose transporter Tret1-like [Copidosoma floridanum]|uniref:facilitated trehalose transporter Tret1-like n=1 Tax=Copidosoma floridanum TaxID=29053 RepID=UPI0006C991FC|nr:facilitated trehalose transporter Tret1-like [Copidosoma floridanum]
MKEPGHVAEEKKVFYAQYIASGTLSLVMLVVGLANGWSSPYLAKLSLQESMDDIPKASDEQLTWLASLMNMGRIFGAVIGAIVQDTLGRKMSLCFAGLPLMCGWICSSVAASIAWLYTARILWGLGMGMIWTTISLYLAEIADSEIRGSLVLWNITTQSIGQFLGVLLGPRLSVRTYGYVCMVPNGMFLLLFPFIPDSPYRYVMVGDMEKAEASLQWFRRQRNVKQDLMELQDYVNSSQVTLRDRLRELGKPKYLKSFGTMFLINISLFFGAFNVINNYMEIILSKSGVSLTPSDVVVGVGFFAIISGLAATCLVDRLGRRFLMISSSLGMALFLGAMGLHFLLILELGHDAPTLTWLPCTCLLLYTASYSAGVGCIPSTLVGELFSPSLKTIASLSYSGCAALFSSLSAGTFIPLLNLVGPVYLFWLYATGTLLSAVFFYFTVPETMGKSLKDIQAEPEEKT